LVRWHGPRSKLPGSGRISIEPEISDSNAPIGCEMILILGRDRPLIKLDRHLGIEFDADHRKCVVVLKCGDAMDNPAARRLAEFTSARKAVMDPELIDDRATWRAHKWLVVAFDPELVVPQRCRRQFFVDGHRSHPIPRCSYGASRAAESRD
jgi:hypothetical protein